MSNAKLVTLNNALPTIVFDSRRAKSVYEEFGYYRSASFDVPAGYVALIEMTTAIDYFPTMTFGVHRVIIGNDECYKTDEISKMYRRWKCQQSLGDYNSPNGIPTSYTPYNQSLVQLGWDSQNDQLVEFEYITRPGRYFLIGLKCNNQNVEDCTRPTVFEVTLIPQSHIQDLALCPNPQVVVNSETIVDSCPDLIGEPTKLCYGDVQEVPVEPEPDACPDLTGEPTKLCF